MAGRKALAPAETVGPQLANSLPAAISAETDMRQRTELIVAEYGDGLPWHPDHYEAAIRNEMRRGCEAFVRAGRYLIVARECATHGEWQGMLDRLGLDRSIASRMTEAARRMDALPNVATSQHLIAATKTQGKLIELLSLPEEEFTELAETGETAHGLTLDDVERMTTRELRAAIREARADIAAKDERADKREREIERKTTEIARLKREAQRATPDAEAVTLRARLTEEVVAIEGAILAEGEEVSSLRTRVAALVEHAEAHGIETGPYLAGVFAQLERCLFALRDAFGIERVAVGDPAVEARLALGRDG